MKRLIVHVEGQTEEQFVNAILAPYLLKSGYSRVAARLLGKSSQRRNRGGICGWPQALRSIVRHLKQDRKLIVTTMVDFYGLPQKKDSSWPNRAQASKSAYPHNANLVKCGMIEEVRNEVGKLYNPDRFVPYIMMYEFEALLFSDCGQFCQSIGYSNLSDAFQNIRDDFQSPEEINDSPDSSPSKRIQERIPAYDKLTMSAEAIAAIGLSAIRSECPQFGSWLDRLEGLGRTNHGI